VYKATCRSQCRMSASMNRRIAMSAWPRHESACGYRGSRLRRHHDDRLIALQGCVQHQTTSTDVGTYAALGRPSDVRVNRSRLPSNARCEQCVLFLAGNDGSMHILRERLSTSSITSKHCVLRTCRPATAVQVRASARTAGQHDSSKLAQSLQWLSKFKNHESAVPRMPAPTSSAPI
jgi:hypothetical protein